MTDGAACRRSARLPSPSLTLDGWILSVVPAGSTSADHDELDPLTHDAALEQHDQAEHPRALPPTGRRWIYLTSAGDLAARDIAAPLTGLPSGVTVGLDPDQLDPDRTTAQWIPVPCPPGSHDRGPGVEFATGETDVDITIDTGATPPIVRGPPRNVLLLTAGDLAYQAWEDQPGATPRQLTGLPAGLSLAGLDAVLVYVRGTTITSILVGWP